MKVFITGAGGFLGQAVVTAALRSGHEVIALVRPSSTVRLAEGVRQIAGDLRQLGAWQHAAAEADAVIHCAAAFGDLSAQLTGTVLATENLLSALPAGLKRFVHVSTLSVYDFNAPSWYGLLDEDTPLESDPLRRDAYTQTKLIQERIIRKYAANQNTKLVVARPGAIYGPGKDWEAGSALKIGSFDVVFAPFSRMRLIHVSNCADALVSLLEVPLDEPLNINLVDPEQPTHWGYHRMVHRAGVATGTAIPIPYTMVRGFGLAARMASILFFKGRARLPELLDTPRQKVRWRPLRYSTKRAYAKLGLAPRLSLKQGVATLTPAKARSIAEIER